MYYFIILIFIFIILFIIFRNKKSEKFSPKDRKAGLLIVKKLQDMLERGEQIPNVSQSQLRTLQDDIYLAVCPDVGIKENLKFFSAENTRYWPYNYYSFPYNYKYGGAWPPGMFSRLRFWSPGYYSGSGLRYAMRPGIGHKYWPRNRWIRHTSGKKNNYYYVTNRGNYIHDAGNYANTPLQFH